MAVPKIDLSRLLSLPEENEGAASYEFSYQDAESLDVEVAEFFSYAENSELDEGRVQFERDLAGKAWKVKSAKEQQDYIYICLEQLESSKPATRLSASRKLLYIALGAYGECASFQEQLCILHKSNLLLFSCGAFPIFVQGFIQSAAALQQRARGADTGLGSTFQLRVFCDLIYLLLESFRHLTVQQPSHSRRQSSSPSPGTVSFESQASPLLLDIPDNATELLAAFRRQLAEPQFEDQTFLVVLLELLTSSKEASNTPLPVKKIVLMAWKTGLLTLGGTQQLEEIKAKKRAEAGLEPAPPGSLLVPPTSKALLAPKASKADIEAFQIAVDSRVYQYSTSSSSSTAARPSSKTAKTLPPALNEAFGILQKHLYISLGEHQMEEFAAAAKEAVEVGSTTLPLAREDTPAERLYAQLVHRLPKHSIALLRILLAAAPASSPTGKQGIAGSQPNLLRHELNEPAPGAPLVAMARDDVDEQRHKEIVIKGIAALVLLLLRHFKQSHVLQFEFFSQTLVEARCLPLILKILNQNVEAYVSLKNSIPSCELFNFLAQWRAESRTFRQDETVPGGKDGSVCPRNMHAIIDLLRILQKLTKHKKLRVLNLVMQKSAPILKKCLRVSHPVMNYYVYKVIKSQTQYLGRGWKKSNMPILSRIDKHVRHRLRDSWFYENIDSEAVDYQWQEDSVKTNTDSFNLLHYAEPDTSNQELESIEPGEWLTEKELQRLYDEWVADQAAGRTFDVDTCMQQLVVGVGAE